MAITGRELVLPGRFLTSRMCSFRGIINDGTHVDYANVRNAGRPKGDISLVTDATAPAGANIDQFDFAGKHYTTAGLCGDATAPLRDLR